jgi:hypothetical protein
MMKIPKMRAIQFDEVVNLIQIGHHKVMCRMRNNSTKEFRLISEGKYIAMMNSSQRLMIQFGQDERSMPLDAKSIAFSVIDRLNVRAN